MAENRLKSVVEIGGEVSGSVKGAVRSVADEFLGLDKRLEKLNGRKQLFDEISSFDMKGLSQSKKDMHAAQGALKGVNDELKAVSESTASYSGQLKAAQAKERKAAKQHTETQEALASLEAQMQKTKKPSAELKNAHKKATEAADQASKAYYEQGNAVRTLSKTVEAAKKKQKSLATAQNTATKNVEKATAKYKRQSSTLSGYYKKLKKTGVNMRDLAGESKKLNRSIDITTKKLNALQHIKSFGKKVLPAAKVGAAVSAGGIAATGYAVNEINQNTTERLRQADSLGVSGQFLQNASAISVKAGLPDDAFDDIVEELTNKFGESFGVEEMGALKDALPMLKVSLEEFEGMNAEQRTTAVLDSIKNADSREQASSALDMVAGGEGNKLAGYLYDQKGSFSDQMKEQDKLNAMTDEGRSGAKAFTGAMGSMKTAVGSVSAEMSGLVGSVFAPMIKETAPQLVAFFRDNREEIKKWITNFRDEGLPAIREFFSGVSSGVSNVVGAIKFFADLVGGFGNLGTLIATAFGVKMAFGVAKFGMSLVDTGAAVKVFSSKHLPGLSTKLTGVGGKLSSFASSLVPKVVGAISGMGSTIAGIASATLPALAGGLSAIWAGLSSAAVAAWGFTAAMLANPMTWIVVGIMAAVAAVYRLITAWDDIKKAFAKGGVWGAIKTFAGFGDDEEDEDEKKTPTAAVAQAMPPVPNGAPSATAATRSAFPDESVGKSSPAEIQAQAMPPVLNRPPSASAATRSVLANESAGTTAPAKAKAQAQVQYLSESNPLLTPPTPSVSSVQGGTVSNEYNITVKVDGGGFKDERSLAELIARKVREELEAREDQSHGSLFDYDAAAVGV